MAENMLQLSSQQIFIQIELKNCLIVGVPDDFLLKKRPFGAILIFSRHFGHAKKQQTVANLF
jgi:hypothetical protein